MPRYQHSTTLTQFLIDERRRFPQASGEFNGLILDVASACKVLARAIARGTLRGYHRVPQGDPGYDPGEARRKIDVWSHDCFVRFNEGSGALAGLHASSEAAPVALPASVPRGKYLLAITPLDGSEGLDLDEPMGSIFSVLRAPEPAREATASDFLRPGREQLCAGYALYGPATLFVLSVGRGVHGFTLDPDLGEFVLTHPGLTVPAEAGELSLHQANARLWESPVQRYVKECGQGAGGARGKAFALRGADSPVVAAHRVLLRGGVALFPSEAREAGHGGRFRLLHEANPLAFLVEQAGGRASTGRGPLLDVVPASIDQREGVFFGAREEIERIERYHHDPQSLRSGDPLFGDRGLFRE